MRRENQTRDGQVSAEQDTDPRLAAQGLVKLIPPPCESHGGGIQLDEPFWFQRNPPPPRRLLHETGTRGPVHSGVVYGGLGQVPRPGPVTF